MRKLFFTGLILALTTGVFAQTPQFFQYQCVVRDVSGTALINQPVNFQISIISGSTGGTVEYTETHNTSTNPYGIANLEIGNGTPVTGSFASVSWGTASHFIKVEADPTGGTTYIDMGTTQLLSVPYALYAEQSGSVDSLWNLNGDNIYNSNTGNVGVGISNPLGKMVIQGDPLVSDTIPLFEIKNATGQTIFVVYPDSVHIYVKDEGAKSNKGGFAVSGRNNSKALTNNFLTVTPDSTRIFTGDTVSGFGVENIGVGNSTSYMHITPSNYFIGHQAGMSNTTGVYNSFLGYQTGKFNTIGNSNVFIGYQTGMNNVAGKENTAIGTYALNSNSYGDWNTATGTRALQNNLSGIENVATGDYSLYINSTGNGNSAFGSMALYMNSSGSFNSGFGKYVLKSNTTGQNNSALGNMALQSNTIGNANIAVGSQSLLNNISGSFNTAVGSAALLANTIGGYNTAVGSGALITNISGDNNTALGYNSMYMNTTGMENISGGTAALFSNTTGSFNTAFGNNALIQNKTGNYNSAFGNVAYFMVDSLSNTTCIGYWSGGMVNASNRIEVGNASINWIGGQVAWSTYSDERIKDFVQEDVPGLDFINLLRPVTYNLNIHRQNEMCKKTEQKDLYWNGKYDLEKIRMTGFLAQEVIEAAKKIGYDFSGVEQPKDESELYSIRYSDFTVPLVKAVQDLYNISIEQSNKIYKLEEENNELKIKINEISKLKTEIEYLKNIVQNQK